MCASGVPDVSQLRMILLRSQRFLSALLVTCALVTAAVAADSKSHTSAGQDPQREAFQARPYQGQLERDDGQWIRPAKDYASLRYSTLDQINTQNVKNLKLAFTFSTGTERGHEAAPLVVNNTMYIVTPWPNDLFALDLTKPGAPVKWRYDPLPSAAAKGEACCDWVNRGAAFDSGKIFYNTLDGFTVAVDANTGKAAWKTHLADITKGETIT